MRKELSPCTYTRVNINGEDVNTERHPQRRRARVERPVPQSGNYAESLTQKTPSAQLKQKRAYFDKYRKTLEQTPTLRDGPETREFSSFHACPIEGMHYMQIHNHMCVSTKGNAFMERPKNYEHSAKGTEFPKFSRRTCNGVVHT